MKILFALSKTPCFYKTLKPYKTEKTRMNRSVDLLADRMPGVVIDRPASNSAALKARGALAWVRVESNCWLDRSPNDCFCFLVVVWRLQEDSATLDRWESGFVHLCTVCDYHVISFDPCGSMATSNAPSLPKLEYDCIGLQPGAQTNAETIKFHPVCMSAAQLAALH